MHLYDTGTRVGEGGSGFRARWGVERKGVSLLAEDSYPLDSEIKGGYPEFTIAVLKKLRWFGDLTEAELKTIRFVGGDNIDAVSGQTDLSGGIQRVAVKHGCAPFGNGRRAPTRGTWSIRSRCIASRSTRRAAT